MADVNINLFKKIEENTTETDGFPEGYLIASVNGKVQGVDPDSIGGGGGDLEVYSTPVINGTNKSVFYNDNGVFSETHLTYETKNGYEVLTGNGVGGGFYAGLVEVLPSVSLPFVGLVGYPNITGVPYINAVVDGSGIGQPVASINGWLDYGGVSNTSVEINDDGYIHIIADNDVNINADNDVNINADNDVNINADNDVNINALNDIWVKAGDENSANTNISFSGKTFKNSQVEEYFFGLEDEQFNLGNNNNGWEVVFGFDLLNKTAVFDSDLQVNSFNLDGYLPFGQQFQTGQSHTVDDLITVLQSMGILNTIK